MKLTFFLFLESIWQKHFFRCKPIFFFFGWMSEDLYNRRGCLKHFEHFSFFIFIKFHWQIICYLRKEGRGHCFSKLIFWYKYKDRVNLWIWRYKPPPPTPAFLRPVFQNEQGKIYTMYVNIFTRWCFHSQKCVSDLQKTWQEICYLSATALGEWHRYLYVINSPVNLSIMYLGNCITVYLCTCVPVYI